MVPYMVAYVWAMTVDMQLYIHRIRHCGERENCYSTSAFTLEWLMGQATVDVEAFGPFVSTGCFVTTGLTSGLWTLCCLDLITRGVPHTGKGS